MTNFVSDIITYIRRIVKTPSDVLLTDNLIIDYINRFWMFDVDARIQLFDLKTTYQFQTTPGVDKYNMPLYSVQVEPGPQNIAMFPVYQGFFGPCLINGIEMPFYTQRTEFYSVWPNYNQTYLQVGTGDGTNGPYNFTLPFLQNATPTNSINTGIIRGHVDMTGIIDTNVNQDPPLDTGTGSYINNTTNSPIIRSTSIYPGVYFSTTDVNGANAVVADTGILISTSQNLGELMAPGNAPYGNQVLQNAYFSIFTITGATQANPVVLTVSSAPNFAVNQTVEVNNVLGITELNGNTYTVLSTTPTTVTIDVDGTGFTAYTAGGDVSSYTNVIDYLTGQATNVFFTTAIPANMPIAGQCVFYQTGIPRAVLFYNNTLVFRAPPNTQYLIELNAYLSPAAFLSTGQASPFGYMCEYIARGAARKILSDVGDVEQFNFYEPLFKEQETLVWKRSQRQFTSTRTQTIYSHSGALGVYNQSSFGV